MAISSGYKQKCPSCEHLVPIKDESLVGKKVDCPKCKYRFVVEAAKVASTPPEDGEDEKKPAKKLTASPGAKTATKSASTAAQPEAKDAKAANGKAKSKPLPKANTENDAEDTPKKKKKKGNNTQVMIGAGIGVLALVLLTVGYFVFFADEGSAPAPQPKTQVNNTNPNPNPPPVNNGAEVEGTNTVSTENGVNPNPYPPSPKEKVNPNLKDITNLLPENSFSVLTVDMPKVMRTPVGEVLFERGSGAEGFFRTAMGFSPSNLKTVIQTSNPLENWEFWIVRLNTPIRVEDLQVAMKLESRPAIKNRPWFTTKEVPIIRMMDEYFALTMKGYDITIPETKRDMFAVNLLDSQTLIIGDVAPVEKFLKADAQPRFNTQLGTVPVAPKTGSGSEGSEAVGSPGSPPNPMGSPPGNPMGSPPGNPMGSPPGNPIGFGPMGFGPMGFGPMGQMGPMGGQGGNPNQPAPLFTDNPTYRTIDAKMEGMLNLLDPKNEAVVLFVTKVPDQFKPKSLDFARPTPKANEKEKEKVAPKGPSKDDLPEMPKLGMIGGVLMKCDPERCKLSVAIDVGTDSDAKTYSDVLQLLILPGVARDLSVALGLEIATSTTPPSQGGVGPEGEGPLLPGGSPSGPGGRTPMGGGPLGGIGGPGGVNRSGELAGGSMQLPELYQKVRGQGGAGAGEGVGTPPGIGIPPGGIGGSPLGGFPGMNNNTPTNTNAVSSTLTTTSSNSLMIITLDLDWKDVYQTNIAPPIRTGIQIEKGKAMMVSGLSNWHNLALAVKKMKEEGDRKGGTLPQGALPRPGNPDRFNMNFPPDQRLSWMVEMLPYLGYDQFHREIDKSQAWNYESADRSNLRVAGRLVAEFLNPSSVSSSWKARLQSLKGQSVASTHFIGLAGVGMDSPYWQDNPQNAKKLGLFGFDRVVKWEEITDKPEETIFTIQVPSHIQRPWIRGGGATVQGVPETSSFAAFVSVHPDGKSGAYAIMADGSIRFIKSTIPDATFQALVTYKGGESVANLDEFTELIPVRGTELKSRPAAVVEPSAPPKKEAIAEPKSEAKAEPMGDPIADWKVVTLKSGVAFKMPDTNFGRENGEFFDWKYHKASNGKTVPALGVTNRKPFPADVSAKDEIENSIKLTMKGVNYQGRAGELSEAEGSYGYHTYSDDNLIVTMWVNKQYFSKEQAEAFFKSLTLPKK